MEYLKIINDKVIIGHNNKYYLLDDIADDVYTDMNIIIYTLNIFTEDYYVSFDKINPDYLFLHATYIQVTKDRNKFNTHIKVAYKEITKEELVEILI